MELAGAHWTEPLVEWQLESTCAEMIELTEVAGLDQILRHGFANIAVPG